MVKCILAKSKMKKRLVFRQWRKDDLCCKVSKNLAGWLCSSSHVLWKIEIVSDEVVHLTEESCKQRLKEEIIKYKGSRT